MMKIFIYLIVALNMAIGANLDLLSIKHNTVINPSLNTFVFLINGDSDRFRPKQGHSSRIFYINKHDVKNIKAAAKDCECNIVLFHDLRGKAGFIKPKKHFGVSLNVYSNGTPVLLKRFLKYKETIMWNEVDLTKKKILRDLLIFSKYLFPDSKIHFVYRGHSFNIVNNETPSHYDYSNIDKSYGIDDFALSLKQSNVMLETITFAACSMSDFTIASKLSQYSRFMLASQVNIPETGVTGFSFEFLRKIRNTTLHIEKVMGENLLENFLSVNDKVLFLRETPFSVIDLQKIDLIKNDILRIIHDADRKEAQRSANYTYPSQRYIDYRMSNGANERVIDIIKKQLRVKSLIGDFDLGEYLNNIGEFALVSSLRKSVEVFNNTSYNGKHGISFNIRN